MKWLTDWEKLIKKQSPERIVRGFSYAIECYLQQSAFVQVFLAHFCPLGQLLQVACFAFAFLTGTLVFAIREVAANAIASILNMIFFILSFFN
ncbi:hypothetical protein DJ568_13905 [Mucilaginibacter hurinus]|uniref:Uncharacterized protein n=1 Tax=Mucilaginibacter hurinus TaxID=2201324 RepID=A0A367GMW9_9SPHI|nr:hypothetical protein [Mucilaginibacter hurinus]RCH54375.1 hypothetical protein DJ568_13905 [Mucilaginibacter hurinus]